MISLLKVCIPIYLIGSAHGYRQNVLDFCSTVLNGDKAYGGCTCIGRTGKSGSSGPRGMKGNKGDRGDEFDPSELLNHLDVLKNKVERMEKIPEVARTVGQWIQVDLGSPHLINATITQGRAEPGGTTYWVKTYKVACGITDANISIIRERGRDKIFQGNSGTTRKVIGWFPEPMSCRYVRLYPQTWERFLCLRMDILKADCP